MRVLDLKSVDVTYRGTEQPALTGLDLRLDSGQMHAVLGPQNSGTSTLCRLAVGLLADRGTVHGEARAVEDVVMLGDDPEAQLSGMASRVSDEVQLPSRLRGRDPATARDAAMQALESLGAAALWERRLETLSGGQRQVVALAGLLALDPALLVLDQPGLSLDPVMRGGLVAALQDYAAHGGTVLITGHQFDEVAAACEAISVLGNGRIVTTLDMAEPTPQALASHGVWSALPTIAPAGESKDPDRVEPEPAGSAQENPRPNETDTAVAAPAGSETASRPVLSIRGLRAERGGRAVLDGLDLDIRPCEFVALMGANGAGKSTLLKALLGLLEPGATVTGTMTVHRLGEDIALTDLPTHRRAAHLGWVGQDPGTQLSTATVRDELLRAAPLPRHRRRDRAAVRAQREFAVASALEATGLASVAGTHPFDLGTARRKDVVIASSLVTSPPILLLDEPTQGRDDGDMSRLTGFITDFLRGGGAVLAATHDERWAADAAHRVVRLEAGRLAERRIGA